MTRFIIPTILIAITITGFFLFTQPLYRDIVSAREQIASYNEALTNSKALEAERDKLTQKYNSFIPEDLLKLQKLLPDNVDNIRLILEIEKVAAPYGMTLKDVKYDTTSKNTSNPQTNDVIDGNDISVKKNYGTLNLEFSIQSTYNNFLNFIKDIESNLRIVDISSIEFSSANTNSSSNPSLQEVYKYTFKVKTYWLKN